MGEHLTLRLDDGSTLTLSVRDDGRLHVKVEVPGQEFAGMAVSVVDDLGLASVAVWARDRLRAAR